MKTDLGSKYKHVRTLPVGQVLSIIQELPEPGKEELGKAVRVASGPFTYPLRFKDRQTASYDCTGLPPSVKHRPVIPFTWKEGSQVQCLPGLQESLWTSIHCMLLATPGMIEILGWTQEVGMGLSLQKEATPSYTFIECVSIRPVLEKTHLSTDSVHRRNEFMVDEGNFSLFFSPFPLVALATLLLD